MFRSIISCLLISLATGIPVGLAQTIRVGSWNIEQLGSPGSRFGDAKDVAQDPKDLADHIKNAGVDVLALQEIGDKLDPGRKSPTLNATFDRLNTGGANWTYTLTANKNLNDKSQLTGVAWNRTKVRQVGSPFRFTITPGSNNFNHWDRHPSAFKFRALGGNNTDFVVVSLHMKAGSRSNNRTQRAEEAQALADRLAAFRATFQEDDIILIGDTNVRSLSEAALSTITGQGFVDLNASGLTTVPWGNVPFDHIFLSTGEAEFAGATMKRVVTNNTDERKKLSDHFLIYTDIKVLADDDTNVPFAGETPAASPTISILAVLPNPVGPDADNENVTLANGGASDVSIAGWQLIDRSGNVFDLAGVVPASATLSITVDSNFPISQSGDDIKLVDANGDEVHSVTYDASQVVEGKFITF